MKTIGIDIETRSRTDIKKAGAYRYALDPSFRILLLAYKIDEEPTRVVDLAMGETLPPDVRAALSDPAVVKTAYNAAFEWYCLNRAGLTTPLEQWRCTMAQASYCGYPLGLGAVGDALGIAEDAKKLKTGRALIKYFCTPADTGLIDWHEPDHDPERWRLFKDYNAQDVEAEHAIRLSLPTELPEAEQRLWVLTTAMNAYGVRVDLPLVEGAAAIDDAAKAAAMEEAKRLTGLDNPGSNAQLLTWLRGRGLDVTTIDKATVAESLERDDLDEEARQALLLRQQTAKASTAKYLAILASVGQDERVRGLTQYFGAKTGRFSGRLVQMQNLPRNHEKTLDTARRIVRAGDGEALRLIYGEDATADILSQLIRTAFIPSEGRRFVVADYSAIEARVIAWIAGETWANEVFATHGKIYEATASQMFHVPMDRIKKGLPEYELRAKGKVATLALGYQGGPAALVAMGALKQGIAEEDLPDIVSRWRKANPNIAAFWYSVEEAVLEAVDYGAAAVQGAAVEIPVECSSANGRTYLTIGLPSGRRLYYCEPRVHTNAKGREALHFMAPAGTSGKWSLQSTYGGKLVENIVQAVARDCLAETLRILDQRGWQVVFHVHDEVIIDAPEECTLDAVLDIMGTPIPWAPGLVLKGAGFEGAYYMKD